MSSLRIFIYALLGGGGRDNMRKLGFFEFAFASAIGTRYDTVRDYVTAIGDTAGLKDILGTEQIIKKCSIIVA